ncbi:MAG: ABC transporter permease, partial [Verrucomicrobiia bacterium]
QKIRGVLRWRSEWTQFQTLFGRSFRSKLRNKTNLYTTIVAAPALALLVATVLRYSPTGEYDFASAAHVPRYLFISLLVAMFLGLTNSADDIIRDRPVLQRERNLGVRVGYYVTAKFLTLAIFGAVQCLLYIFVGHAVIEARGMVGVSFLYLFLTSLCGISIGLLISSRVADAKTAANLVPIVLIPQIMLAGALISYEEMNKNLDLKHSLTRFLAGRSTENVKEVRSDLEVPFVCEFMPLRWSYEALVLAQAKLNPLTRRQEVLQRLIRSSAAIQRPTAEDSARLENYKNLLAALSGIEGDSPGEVGRLLREVDRMTREGVFDRQALVPKGRRFSGEQLFVNQQIVDLVAKAEFEEADYRREGSSVFFGRTKRYFFVKGDTLVFNGVVLGCATLLFLVLLHATLRAQLRMEGE